MKAKTMTIHVVNRQHQPTIQPNRYEAKQAARLFGLSSWKDTDTGNIRYIIRVTPYEFVEASMVRTDFNDYAFTFKTN